MKASIIDSMTEGDTVRISVTVKNDDGSVRDLTDATVKCWAVSASTTVEATSAAITDEAGGVLELVFSAGALSPTVWRIQTQVTLPTGDVQTVSWAMLTIAKSYIP